MENIFLSESLVKLVLKISQQYSIDNFSLFSILDTLDFALNKKYQRYRDDEEELIDKEEMSILIINIIRLCEKYNNIKSKLIKNDRALKMGSDKINSQEFAAYKSFDFKVQEPTIADEIFKMICTNFDEQKDELLEISLDTLKLFYCLRTKIFDEVYESNGDLEVSKRLLSDEKSIAATTIAVALKLSNFSEAKFNAAFDAICDELNPSSSKEINILSAIFFSLLKVDASSKFPQEQNSLALLK